MMVGKNTLGYSRVLADAARILWTLEDSGRGVWQYQHGNRYYIQAYSK
jgi:hypothetical protein